MHIIELAKYGVTAGPEPVGRRLNALFAEHAGKKLHLPAGTYLVEETLRIHSGTTLMMDPGAVLRLADGAATCRDDYLLTNANPDGGDSGITISGGAFDGNQIGNPRPKGLFDEGYSGAMLHFQNLSGLRIQDCRFTNAEAYYARFREVRDFHIEGITFDSDRVRPNNDGIHLGGNCTRGVIRRLSATTPGVTGDDMVALNADDALNRTEVRGMVCGDISDILIEDIQAASCHTFVRLLCVQSRIRNVTIRGLRGGCHVAAINADGARNCRVPLFDSDHPPFPDGVGLLENILVEDLHVHKVGPNSMALIDLRERLHNFEVRRFIRDEAKDAAPDTPSLRLQHQKLKNACINGEAITAFNTLAPQSAYERMDTQLSCLLNT